MEIRGHHLSIPVLQGGMGVGVSLGGLAGAVAACGGMGTISTADAGYQEPDFPTDPAGANLRALRREIGRAKELARGAGMVAVNAMVATRQFADAVRTAVAAGVDAVVCGAGLPLELPALTQGKTAIAPIVSSPRAARLLLKTWDRKYQTTADFLVLEGSRAGGHLGFGEEALKEGTCPSLEDLLPGVLAETAPYAEKYGHPIPVFPAGGIWSGADMARLTRLGAAGIQMATRFIATWECDASQGYKDVLLEAGEEDLAIIHSPVGMPGRAVRTPLIRRLEAGERLVPQWCAQCMQGCRPSEIPFCITHALIQAVKGNREEGLFFSGASVGLLDRMCSVRELMEELIREWRALA